LAATFDPFETGFVNWKAFVVTAARVLPVSLRDLHAMRETFQRLPSWNGRTVSKADYMTVRSWYEDPWNADDGEAQQRVQPQHEQQFEPQQPAAVGGMAGVLTGDGEEPIRPPKFNRRSKMKLALFRKLLRANGRRLQLQQLLQADDERPTTSRSRPEGEESSETAATPPPPGPSTAGSPSGPGAPILGEHDAPNDDNWLFDVQEFLLYICPDEHTRSGVQKAFVAGAPFGERYKKDSDGMERDGEEEDYCLTPAMLYRVFHRGLRLVPETHRLGGRGHPKDPYPMVSSWGLAVQVLTHYAGWNELKQGNSELPDLMQRIVDEGGERGVINFEQFAQTTDALAGLLACPLYQLCEISLGKATAAQPSPASIGGTEAIVA
ncbi:MAG: hypothetical protein BJ554DRAFT_4041, partial [Olpidium bornovanus]